MGFYTDQLVPRVLDRTLGAKGFAGVRTRVCAGLTGEVVEIGFGSGLNVPFYPPAVTRVAAVEPSGTGWRLARERVGAASVPIELSGLDGESLPFPTGRFDSALSTFTLCTIPDVARALAEVRRVLKPGGSLHFLEHGLAPDPAVQRWQHRLEPLQKRFVGGCHLTREIPALLTDAGFTVTSLTTFYMKATPRYGGAFSMGTASAP